MTFTKLQITCSKAEAIKDDVCKEMTPSEYYILDDNPCIIRKELTNNAYDEEPLIIDLIEDDGIDRFQKLSVKDSNKATVVCWEKLDPIEK